MKLGRFGLDEGRSSSLVGLAHELHRLPPLERSVALAMLEPNTLQALQQLKYEWALFAREQQFPPQGSWRWWVMTGGRAGGKTRAACEYALDWLWTHPGGRAAFTSKDYGGYVKIMLKGKSGILNICPPWFKPKWWKKDKLLECPNGAIVELHTSEEPATHRGPEYEFHWLEEFFHWGIPRGEKAPEAWEEGIRFNLRLGERPHGVITSTPVPTEFCMDFLLGAEDDQGARPITEAMVDSGAWSREQEIEVEGEKRRYTIEIRRWSSEANSANLAPGFVEEQRADLAGTALEDQELNGKIPRRPVGTLFKYEDLDSFSVDGVVAIPQTVFVAVDPTRSDAPKDECGIVVGFLGRDGHCYVLDDLTLTAGPKGYAKVIVEAANRNRADKVVLEKNRLPQSTRTLIRTTEGGESINWQEVWASDGKFTRAEPASKAVAEGRVHLVRDRTNPRKFDKLKNELVWFNPRTSKKSPNRMDAFVWLVTAALKLDPNDRVEIS